MPEELVRGRILVKSGHESSITLLEVMKYCLDCTNNPASCPLLDILLHPGRAAIITGGRTNIEIACGGPVVINEHAQTL